MFRDKNFDWLRVHKYIHWSEMELFVATTIGGAAMAAAHTKAIAINSKVLYAPNINASAEYIAGQLMLPTDMDPAFSMKFRVHWCWANTSTTHAGTWAMVYSNLKRAATLATPATALDTAIAAQTPGTATAYLPLVTGWGVINADKWTRAEIEAGHLLAFKLTYTSSDYYTTVHPFGLEYSYVPQFTQGLGSEHDFDAAA